MTNRALVLAALADSPTEIRNPLAARDAELAQAGLRALGLQVADTAAGVLITPAPMTGPAEIDCGLAGTVMRFFPPIAALATGTVRFDGDERARLRPLSPLLQALRQLGVTVDGDGLPVQVHGTGRVTGSRASIDASGSSQFISGLLLSAARFDAGLHLQHVGAALPSLPHIEMTMSMLQDRGVTVGADASNPQHAHFWVDPGPIKGGEIVIEPDLSNAGAFLAAAMVTQGAVSIPDWPQNTTQAGDEFRSILQHMGATVTHGNNKLTVHGPAVIQGIDLDLSAIGELTPTVAAVAAFADSPSYLRGIGHLRGHETDRLQALSTELNRLGARVVETEDELHIFPGRMHAAEVQCYADHRMATFGAIIGLGVPGVTLSDVSATAKTMPNFAAMWLAMVGH